MRRRQFLPSLLAALAIAACAPAASPPAPAAPASNSSAPAAPSSAAPAPAAAPGATPVPRTVRIAMPAASLSLLPFRVADERGLFAAQGITVEWVLLAPELGATAILAGEVGYTTTPSTVASVAAQGGPLRIFLFSASKLQHQIVGRPELRSMADLAGKRIAVFRQGDLTAFEVRWALDHFGVQDATVLSVGRETDRLASVLSGAADATVLPVPADIVAEREGLRVLLAVGDVLEVPLAGLGTHQDRLRDAPDEIAGLVRGAIQGTRYLRDPANADDVVALIAHWVGVTPEEARVALDRVRDTYTPNGLPTEQQLQTFLTMLRATGAAGDDVTPDQISDFRITRQVAGELGVGP
ncbi:MAG TPA: ABC transporter substrate-binding protein [Chloroflexota bacterium]|jgi:NitT/TauT family transport system substrate-binding protein